MTTLLFDFGGTIDTDGVHWSEKYWDAYVRAGITLEKQHFEKAYVAAESHMYAVIREDEGLRSVLCRQVLLQFEALRESGAVDSRQLTSGLAIRIGNACFEEARRNVTQLRPLLSRWSKTLKLGLVSNFYGNLPAVCCELSIAPFFNAIVDSTRVHVRKPDPGILSIALRLLHASAAETCVVGDSYDRDIVPAKSLGCTTVWLCGRSWHAPPDVSQADRIITSLHELQAFIDERGDHGEREEH